MSSEQVQITVFSDGRRVDGPMPRPVRLLPSGKAGVVYGGWVYPLHQGAVIELSDTPFAKTDCPGFVTAGAAVPFAGQSETPDWSRPVLGVNDWYLESNRFGHYLVFDG